MRGVCRAALAQGLQNRFDKAVARVAGSPFTVRPDVSQFTAAVPDRDGRTGAQMFCAVDIGQRFEGTQADGQLAVCAGSLNGIKLDTLWRVVGDQLTQVLVVAHIARATRVPEVHDANGARP